MSQWTILTHIESLLSLCFYVEIDENVHPAEKDSGTTTRIEEYIEGN